MATTIEQKPRHTYLPAGQDVIFSVSNNAILTNPDYIRVKFVAIVHISDQIQVNLGVNTTVVGTFKTTPNNAGSGMFNFSPIIESFVNADNKARASSTYKEVLNTNLRTPIHLIDKFSGNNNSFRWFGVRFKTQYTDNLIGSPTFGQIFTVDVANSDNFKLFNGYLKYTDKLEYGAASSINDFGFNMFEFNLNSLSKKFLTNAPAIQYANIEDYGTSSILMINPIIENLGVATQAGGTGFIRFDYYKADGTPITGSPVTSFETIRLDEVADGGFNYADRPFAYNKLIFAGVFPANLRNYSTLFNANIDNIAYYTYEARTFTVLTSLAISKKYTININCPNLKGYKPIRLTWMNQWGTWDYYTFNMKSTKKISTKGTTYQQLEGTWNESTYKVDSFRGGKKAFRVNATEKISINTDFVSESESEWFEELINSPEVYILDGFHDDATTSALNEYVTPARITTSSYTKKTVANDKLMQYTFEIEKSKTLRTQSI